MKYMANSRCVWKDGIYPVCECSSMPFTIAPSTATTKQMSTVSIINNSSTVYFTTTTSRPITMTNSLSINNKTYPSILPSRCKYLELLSNDDLVCSGSQKILIWDLRSIEIRLHLTSSNKSYYFEDYLVVLPNDDLVAAYQNILIWDTKNGSLKMNLSGHDAPITSLAVLSDGDLASGGEDQLIKIWDMETGQLKRTLTGHTSRINALAAFGDDYLASSARSSLRIWNAKTGEVVRNLPTTSSDVACLAALSNGYLASSHTNYEIEIWDPLEGLLKKKLIGNTANITVLVALSNGNLVSRNYNRHIRIWNVEAGITTQSAKATFSFMSLNAIKKGLLIESSNSKIVSIGKLSGLNQSMSTLPYMNINSNYEIINSLALSKTGDLLSVGDTVIKV
jgi:WD40 repeat protein